MIEEPRFLASAKKLYGSAEKADDALQDTVHWCLAREGDFSGYPIVGKTPTRGHMYAMKTRGTIHLKPVVVLFGVNGASTAVTLHDVRFAEETDQ